MSIIRAKKSPDAVLVNAAVLTISIRAGIAPNPYVFQASLNHAIDDVLNVNETYAETFDACGGASVGSMESTSVYSIAIGATGGTYNPTASSNVTQYRVVTGAIINGTLVNNNTVLTIGTYQVTIVLQQCLQLIPTL